MEETRAAESTPKARKPPSLCPKCGVRPRRQEGGYCRECFNERRKQSRIHKSRILRCPDCRCPLPHEGKNGCPERKRRYWVGRGRERLNARWPEYGDVVQDEGLLHRAGLNWPRVAGFPRPSEVFPGLDPDLDAALIRDKRDKDVVLCRAVAAIPRAEQREFLALYLVDPADAARWATLPAWKRILRKGDPDDHHIWAFFTIYRLNMNVAADGRTWPLPSQGASHPQLFGCLDRITGAGVKRLCEFMYGFLACLQEQRDLGDVVRKPWA